MPMLLGGVYLFLIVMAFVFARTLAIMRFYVPGLGAETRPHSVPNFHAYFAAWTAGFFMLLMLALYRLFFAAVGSVTIPLILMALITALTCLMSFKLTQREFKARDYVEGFVQFALFLCSGVVILITFGIILSLLFESLRFFEKIPLTDFLTGLEWSPQIPIREDQIGEAGSFGVVPVLLGTGLITVFAMLIAVPIGLFIAIYLSEYAGRRRRRVIKPVIEILAGIPSVVYGFFALLTIGPMVQTGMAALGFDITAQSVVAVSIVMGVMIIPYISSLSDDVMSGVPQILRDGSYALGATPSETVKKIILPAAFPGLMAASLLGVSRALGETMIVALAASKAANLTFNPFEAVTTVTVQIVTLLTGDQELDSAKTLAAYALGLILFILTLLLNIIAISIVRGYNAKFHR